MDVEDVSNVPSRGRSRRVVMGSLLAAVLPNCASGAGGGNMTGEGRERVYIAHPQVLGDLDILPRWTNRPAVRTAGTRTVPFPTKRYLGTGFPTDLPTPQIEFARTANGSAVSADTPIAGAYEVAPFWLLSESLWSALQRVDPEGFEAVRSHVQLWDGSVGPSYFLVEPIRLVDCFDYERSRAHNARFADNGSVNLGAGGPEANYFRAEELHSAPFFQLPDNASTCLCTQRAKDEWVGAAEGSIGFFPIGWAV